jgi:hypothetical protein
LASHRLSRQSGSLCSDNANLPFAFNGLENDDLSELVCESQQPPKMPHLTWDSNNFRTRALGRSAKRRFVARQEDGWGALSESRRAPPAKQQSIAGTPSSAVRRVGPTWDADERLQIPADRDIARQSTKVFAKCA